MSIHQFSGGLCADPQVNTSQYYEWIDVFIILYLYLILLISDTMDALYMGVKSFIAQFLMMSLHYITNDVIDLFSKL